MTDEETFVAGTVKSTPEPQAWEYWEDESRPSRIRPILRAGLPAMAAALLGATAAVTVLHFVQHPTVVATHPTVIASPSPSPDKLFLDGLADLGITASGSEARRQRLLEGAHQACYALAPPSPQTFEVAAEEILAAERADAASPDHIVWSPGFDQGAAENVVRVGVQTYCPQFASSLP